MASDFALSVVAPDKAVVEENVTAVVAPGSEGYFGVLAGHEPLIAALRPGLLEYTDGTGNRHFIYVGGGFAEIGENRVTVLADEAARARDIDVSRAEAELEAAKAALRGDDSKFDGEEAVHEVDKAVQRLKAARLPR